MGNKEILISFLSMILVNFPGSINGEPSQKISKAFADNQRVAAKDPVYERHHYVEECSNLSHEMRRFSDKLNDENLRIFCGEFNNAQREKAIQMASQKNSNGKYIMTPDESVQMVVRQR